MAEYYLWLKWTHVASVLASGAVFALRGVAMLARSPLAVDRGARRLSMLIDSVLLASALALVAILHAYPFAQAWLTAKVLLLVVYIALGTLALNRGRTRAVKVGCFFAALAVYLLIISIARTRNPWGALAPLVGA